MSQQLVHIFQFISVYFSSKFITNGFILVDAGELFMNVTKGNVVLAPTKEDMSLKAYSMKRRLNRLRKSACILFQSDPIVRVIEKVEREIECGRLAVRTDRKLHADLGEYAHSFLPLLEIFL